MNARFAPLPCFEPDHRKAGPYSPPPVLEFATSQAAIARAADLFCDRMFNAESARLDRADDFSTMSFADLESLADDLSDGSSWSLLDDVRGEIATRTADAKTALQRLFVVAMESAHAPSTPKLPCVTGGKLDTTPVSLWVYEEVGSGDSQDAIARTYCAGPAAMLKAWREHVEAMAFTFARDSAEELLRAGWSE